MDVPVSIARSGMRPLPRDTRRTASGQPHAGTDHSAGFEHAGSKVPAIERAASGLFRSTTQMRIEHEVIAGALGSRELPATVYRSLGGTHLQLDLAGVSEKKSLRTAVVAARTVNGDATLDLQVKAAEGKPYDYLLENDSQRFAARVAAGHVMLVEATDDSIDSPESATANAMREFTAREQAETKDYFTNKNTALHWTQKPNQNPEVGERFLQELYLPDGSRIGIELKREEFTDSKKIKHQLWHPAIEETDERPYGQRHIRMTFTDADGNVLADGLPQVKIAPAGTVTDPASVDVVLITLAFSGSPDFKLEFYLNRRTGVFAPDQNVNGFSDPQDSRFDELSAPIAPETVDQIDVKDLAKELHVETKRSRRLREYPHLAEVFAKWEEAGVKDEKFFTFLINMMGLFSPEGISEEHKQAASQAVTENADRIRNKKGSVNNGTDPLISRIVGRFEAIRRQQRLDAEARAALAPQAVAGVEKRDPDTTDLTHLDVIGSSEALGDQARDQRQGEQGQREDEVLGLDSAETDATTETEAQAGSEQPPLDPFAATGAAEAGADPFAATDADVADPFAAAPEEAAAGEGQQTTTDDPFAPVTEAPKTTTKVAGFNPTELAAFSKGSRDTVRVQTALGWGKEAIIVDIRDEDLGLDFGFNTMIDNDSGLIIWGQPVTQATKDGQTYTRFESFSNLYRPNGFRIVSYRQNWIVVERKIVQGPKSDLWRPVVDDNGIATGNEAVSIQLALKKTGLDSYKFERAVIAGQIDAVNHPELNWGYSGWRLELESQNARYGRGMHDAIALKFMGDANRFHSSLEDRNHGRDSAIRWHRRGGIGMRPVDSFRDDPDATTLHAHNLVKNQAARNLAATETPYVKITRVLGATVSSVLAAASGESFVVKIPIPGYPEATLSFAKTASDDLNLAYPATRFDTETKPLNIVYNNRDTLIARTESPVKGIVMRRQPDGKIAIDFLSFKDDLSAIGGMTHIAQKIQEVGEFYFQNPPVNLSDFDKRKPTPRTPDQKREHFMADGDFAVRYRELSPNYFHGRETGYYNLTWQHSLNAIESFEAGLHTADDFRTAPVVYIPGHGSHNADDFRTTTVMNTTHFVIYSDRYEDSTLFHSSQHGTFFRYVAYGKRVIMQAFDMAGEFGPDELLAKIRAMDEKYPPTWIAHVAGTSDMTKFVLYKPKKRSHQIEPNNINEGFGYGVVPEDLNPDRGFAPPQSAEIEAAPAVTEVEGAPAVTEVEAVPAAAEVEATPADEIEAAPAAEVEAAPAAEVEAAPVAEVEAAPVAEVEAAPVQPKDPLNNLLNDKQRANLESINNAELSRLLSQRIHENSEVPSQGWEQFIKAVQNILEKYEKLPVPMRAVCATLLTRALKERSYPANTLAINRLAQVAK